MQNNRQLLINELRTWIGVPFRHQGRTRNGVDCGGLLVKAVSNINLLEPEDMRGYGRLPFENRLKKILDKQLIEIKVMKKSRTFAFGAGSFLIGGIYAGATHGSRRKDREETESGEEVGAGYLSESFKYGAICGAAGVLIGMLFGIDKTIKIEGKSDAEINEALKKLSKKARVPEYR